MNQSLPGSQSFHLVSSSSGGALRLTKSDSVNIVARGKNFHVCCLSALGTGDQAVFPLAHAPSDGQMTQEDTTQRMAKAMKLEVATLLAKRTILVDILWKAGRF